MRFVDGRGRDPVQLLLGSREAPETEKTATPRLTRSFSLWA